MGKIRITALGSEEEKELKEKRQRKLEEKKKREANVAEKIHISGLKGGQKVKSVGAQSEEEIEKLIKISREVDEIEAGGIKTEDDSKKSRGAGSGSGRKKVKIRGKNYQSALMKIDAKRQYPISEAVALLRQITFVNFDETIELHINTVEKGLRGTVSLPHGTGKKIRVAIAEENNVEKLVEEISSGKITFDALVAHPKAVGKLARVAKFLGPRGLMPNPKNGTISENPKEIAKKLEGGEISWKTESDFPVIHQVIGKMSFKDGQVVENYQALIKSINPLKIQKIVLKSSMSPGIKIQIN